MKNYLLSTAKVLLLAGLVSAMATPARAHVTVLAPNGGELFNPGDVVTLRWTIAITHNLQNWDIWYSTTGKNGPWIPIVMNETAGSAAVGSIHTYDWTVPNTPADKCRIRVRMDNSGTDYEDISNANFTINAPCGTAANYCTAGTSASGCQASLSTTGTASATAASGFLLNAGTVEGGKGGLYFYGANGRQASTWGNGTSFQCVLPPVKRGGLLVGAGTAGNCDGSFSQDLNARWCPTCPKPSHNPGAGAVVQAQLWYRDPFNTSNQTTSLSDAIEFVVCP